MGCEPKICPSFLFEKSLLLKDLKTYVNIFSDYITGDLISCCSFQYFDHEL